MGRSASRLGPRTWPRSIAPSRPERVRSCPFPNWDVTYPNRESQGMSSKAGATKDVSLAGALFSNVQRRLLGLIFGRPERSFYLSEIIRTVGAGTGAVDRELTKLERSGLVTMERIGNQKH